MAAAFQKKIGDYWAAAGGRPAGFDNLRVILAISVILWHSSEICYGPGPGDWYWAGPFRPLVCYIVPGFFALSGFLVAGSLVRNDLLSFALLRVIRIYPALMFEVLLSALVVGLIATRLPPLAYLTNHRFFSYLLNMTGWIHFYLPGVFETNPAGTRVNLQLWTVPFELRCYLLLTFLALIGLHRKPVAFLCAAIAITIAILIYINLAHDLPSLKMGPPGLMSVLCFVFGVAFFLLKDHIVINIWTFGAAVAAYVILVYNAYGVYAAAPFVAYATIFLGIQNKRLPGVAFLANYSYGIYLYGYVIQQFISYLLPEYRIWWFNFITATSVTLALSAISWHLVEKPVDKNKKMIIKRLTAVRSDIQARLFGTGFNKRSDPLSFRTEDYRR